MTDQPETPQIYLITPAAFDPAPFADQLAACMDATPVACVRLAHAGGEDEVSRAADAIREVCHARDVPLVIDSHILLVERLGLDGVHLTDAARSVRKVRTDLGEDAVVGAYCAASRHDGMTAGELGADYVSFGPVGASALGDGSRAEAELFEWWSMMIEVPVVAEGALDADLIRTLAPHSDFFGLGAEVWEADDPAAALKALHAAML